MSTLVRNNHTREMAVQRHASWCPRHTLQTNFPVFSAEPSSSVTLLVKHCRELKAETQGEAQWPRLHGNVSNIHCNKLLPTCDFEFATPMVIFHGGACTWLPKTTVSWITGVGKAPLLPVSSFQWLIDMVSICTPL